VNQIQLFLFHITPILAFVLAAVFFGTIFYLSSKRTIDATEPFVSKFKERLERANIKLRSEDIAIGLVSASAILWAVIIFTAHPSPLLAVPLLPLVVLLVFTLFGKWVDYKIAGRLTSFNNQLELVLRMMSSSIRAGLGLRQALIMVTEEMPDPARHEFNLTLMQTNIGMSLNDALARLAQRMPSQELDMLTKAIAVQTQTGGNLGKTLDHLAATIKDRRRLFRKVRSITSEGRASASVIGALPVLVAAAIMIMQPDMRSSLLGTDKGHIFLGIAIALESLGVFVLTRILKFVV
jgi:tight adherence protein B